VLWKYDNGGKVFKVDASDISSIKWPSSMRDKVTVSAIPCSIDTWRAAGQVSGIGAVAERLKKNKNKTFVAGMCGPAGKVGVSRAGVMGEHTGLTGSAPRGPLGTTQPRRPN
jgi:hypothetical protein